jgi:prolyl-tRNA editing enzyme YbaK/EbsC (Cys-tRNA(Pro) deacylase)
MDPKVERVVEAGRALDIAVEPHRFSEGTRTAADAAAAVGCEIGQIVKSLVFGSDRGPLLFLVSGANRLDVGLAASVAGANDLHKADAEEARRATGFSIGATPPFGHPESIPTFMDEDLLSFSKVWAAAGRDDSVFCVSPASLRDAIGATVTSLAETSSRER